MLISLPYKYYKVTGNCQLHFWCRFLEHRFQKLYYCQYGGLEHPPVKYILESDVNSGCTHYIKVIWVLQNITSSQALHWKNEHYTSCFESVFRYSNRIWTGKTIPLTTMKHVYMLLNLHFLVLYLISTCSYFYSTLHLHVLFLNTILPAS
jgi:hypothetical protein